MTRKPDQEWKPVSQHGHTGILQPESATSSSGVTLLLQSIQSGNPDAMADLYDQFSRVVYSIALRILNTSESAEEVLHEVFLHVWRCPDGYLAVQNNLAGVLALHTRNKAIDVLRKRHAIDSTTVFDASTLLALSEEIKSEPAQDKVRAILYRLPRQQRRALELVVFEGMTPSEISKLMGVSLATVKMRMQAAFLAIRRALKLEIEPGQGSAAAADSASDGILPA